MGRPYKLKGQPQRADPAYLERLRALQEARKAAPPPGRSPRKYFHKRGGPRAPKGE